MRRLLPTETPSNVPLIFLEQAMTSNDPTQTAGTTSAETSASEKDTATQGAASSALPEGGKVLPPSSPVDVPRMPAPAPRPEVEPDLSDPHGHASSWADSTSADPTKKSVRTSIHNG